MTDKSTARLPWLAYLGAVVFGLAAPVYVFVLGSPSTFTLERLEAVLLVFILQVAPTLALLLSRAVAGRRGTLVDWLVYGASILVVARQVQMIAVSPVAMGSGGRTAAFVGLPALAIAVTYAARRYVELFMTYAGLLSTAAAAYFLWASSVQPARASSGQPGISRQAPDKTLFVFVFDEVSLEALLDANGRIDAAAFPNFSRFSLESIWFRQAITNYPETDDSIRSVLTGSFTSKAVSPDRTLLRRPNLLDALVDNGYSVSFYSRALGYVFDQGNRIDYYSGGTIEKIRRTLISAVGYYVPGRLLFAVAPQILNYPDLTEGEMLASATTSLFTAPGNASVFHLMITHNPYTLLGNGRPIPTGDFLQAEFREGEDPERTFALYREAIRYVDGQFGIFLDRLEQSNAWDRSVVVVTSDHGECWNAGCRQRYLPFSAVEPSLVRVPMFVRSPTLKPRIVDGDYQHVDFFPTVLEALGIPLPPNDIMDGRSALAPILSLRRRPFYVDRDRAVEIDLPPRRIELSTDRRVVPE